MVLEMEDQTLAERADVAPSVVLVLELMSEEKTWTFPQSREQLTPELVDAADKVIVMAERETWPDYLVEGGKVEFWDDRGRLQYSHERRSWHQRPDQS